MNCLEAQALVSAAHDGEAVSESELTAARAHCAECEECTAFVEGLGWLDEMPVTPAPDGLVGRVLAAIEPLQAARAEALALEAEREEAASAASELPVPDEESAALEFMPIPERVPATGFASRFEWFQGPTKWASLGAVAALAATGLIAFVVVGVGTPPGTSKDTAAAPTAGVTELSGAPSATDGGRGTNGSVAGAPQQQAPSQAPDYVLYKDYVYAPGALLADAASATPTIGSLTTAFASGGPVTATVYRSPLTDGSIVVKGPDGLRVYAPVIRMAASVRYQLTSGKPIERFGVWPVLPTRFPAPANADGTPSFVEAGTDSLSVKVYSATGRPVTEGFAVAPGTPTSDPAGGNPNWTWWAPAPTNP
jgi:hypothetical protein